ncbi:MAG: nucleotidyltransferase domain-containing protein [Bacteroidales bacterium]|nr:nucleotidyltransferase domain-containing protein [Bacteroidales bacterium]
MFLDNYVNQIIGLCEKHKVKQLFAFGSVLTNKFSETSDIDFVVDIKSTNPIDYAENYFELKFQLEDLLKRPIDLLEQRGLKNSYLIKSINNTKKLIYES